MLHPDSARQRNLYALSLLLLLIHPSAQGQIEFDTNNVVVSTFAGSGEYAFQDGQGTNAAFYRAVSVAADSTGNLYVADDSTPRIRKITPDGTVSTLLGGGTVSLPAWTTNDVSLSFYWPLGAIAVDPAGTVWTVAAHFTPGSPPLGLIRISTNGWCDFVPVPGLERISGLCARPDGSLYFSNPSSNQVYIFTGSGTPTLVAGSGLLGWADGPGPIATFRSPSALAVDQAGNLYVDDAGNALIRRIDSGGTVTTIAGDRNYKMHWDGLGTNAGFGPIHAMSADDFGNIYLACGSVVRRVSAGYGVTTVAGQFSQSGYTNGPGPTARFDGVGGICFSQGSVYVADLSNNRIRQITYDPLPRFTEGAVLSVSTHARVIIEGFVGRAYRVESSVDLTSWTTEATVLLTHTPFFWVDPQPLDNRKSYRAFLLP